MSHDTACNVIMLVEDDQDIRESIAEALESHGYKVLCAIHGQNALEKLHAMDGGLPSLILLDMMMPIMDGWQFRAVQLEDAKLRSIPVLALTAHADAERIAHEAKTEGILRKPLELRTLLAAVDRFHQTTPAQYTTTSSEVTSQGGAHARGA